MNFNNQNNEKLEINRTGMMDMRIGQKIGLKLGLDYVISVDVLGLKKKDGVKQYNFIRNAIIYSVKEIVLSGMINKQIEGSLGDFKMTEEILSEIAGKVALEYLYSFLMTGNVKDINLTNLIRDSFLVELTSSVVQTWMK